MPSLRLVAASCLALLLVAPAFAAPKQKTVRHTTAQHPPARKATVPGTNPHMKKNSKPVGAPNTRKHHKWI